MESREILFSKVEQFWEEYCESLKGKSKTDNVETKFTDIFDKIISNGKDIQYISGKTNLYRGRIHKGEIKYSNTAIAQDEMGAPSAEKATAGRINFDKEPCLYLTEEQQTCIYEVKPYIKQFITIGTFETKKSKIKILDLCQEEVSGELELNTEIMNFIAKKISEPIPPEDRSSDYLPTQKFAQYVQKKGFDGIKYWSSLIEKGKNVALFNIDFAKCTGAIVMQVQSYSFTKMFYKTLQANVKASGTLCTKLLQVIM